MGLSQMPKEREANTTTLWVLLDVSNSMRGATIESAQNVLQQYVLGQLPRGGQSISLITFGNTAKLLTPQPIAITNFQLPVRYEIGGLCNLSDALSLCVRMAASEDKLLILTKGYTTDSYGLQKCGIRNDCHIVMLDSFSYRIPMTLSAYFSGRMKVYNMKEESLMELSQELINRINK